MQEAFGMKVFVEFTAGFRDGMKLFGHNITVIVNSILLSIVYFTGVGIPWAIAQMLKKRFLDIEIWKKADSYWLDLNLKKKRISEYYRQF